MRLDPDKYCPSNGGRWRGWGSPGIRLSRLPRLPRTGRICPAFTPLGQVVPPDYRWQHTKAGRMHPTEPKRIIHETPIPVDGYGEAYECEQSQAMACIRALAVRFVFAATLLVGPLFAVVSCTSTESPKMSTTRSKITFVELERLYAKHKKNVEAQLRDGRSWIQCDEGVVTELAAAVAWHRSFFRARVDDDFFVAEYILHRTELYQAHKEEIERCSTDIAARQKVWHRILEERTGPGKKG